MKASAEDSSFIGVHIDRNLILSNGSPDGLLNHRRSGGAARKDDGRDIIL